MKQPSKHGLCDGLVRCALVTFGCRAQMICFYGCCKTQSDGSSPKTAKTECTLIFFSTLSSKVHLFCASQTVTDGAPRRSYVSQTICALQGEQGSEVRRVTGSFSPSNTTLPHPTPSTRGWAQNCCSLQSMFNIVCPVRHSGKIVLDPSSTLASLSDHHSSCSASTCLAKEDDQDAN